MKKKQELEDFSVERIQQVAESAVSGIGDHVYFSPELSVVLGGRPSMVFKGALQVGVPYRIENTRMVMLRSGDVKVRLNLRDYHIRAGDAFFASDGSIVQINSFSDQNELVAVAVSEDFLNQAFGSLRPDMLRHNPSGCSFTLSAGEQAMTEQYLHLIYVLASRGEAFRRASASAVASMFHFLDALHVRQDMGTSAGDGISKSGIRERRVFEHFIRLVTENCIGERELAFYADRVCLTPRYLSTVVHQVSGRTAKQWIDNAVITEAKVLLHHSDLTIQQITDRLKFPNPSFFCKYFKRLTGETPRQYRERK